MAPAASRNSIRPVFQPPVRSTINIFIPEGRFANEPALHIHEFLAEKQVLTHPAALNEVQYQQQNDRTDKSGEQTGDRKLLNTAAKAEITADKIAND